MISLIAGAAAVGAAGLGALRVREAFRRDTAWATLRSRTPWREQPVGTAAMATGQPVADRLLRFLIPGPANLRTVAEVGSVCAPIGRRAWREALIVAPSGLAARRFGPWGGSDTVTLVDGEAALARWTLWLAPLRPEPIAATALATRAVGSALMWAPGGLLPGERARWTDLAADATRLTATWRDASASVDISVDRDGSPLRIAGEGWAARPTAFILQDGHRLASIVIEETDGRACERKVAFVRSPGPWIGSSHA